MKKLYIGVIREYGERENVGIAIDNMATLKSFIEELAECNFTNASAGIIEVWDIERNEMDGVYLIYNWEGEKLCFPNQFYRNYEQMEEI